MIRGRVKPSLDDGTGLEAWVSIAVSDGTEAFQTVGAVLDTGYTGWLMIPESSVLRLGLTPIDTRCGTLADSQDRETEYCEAVVIWHDQPWDIWIDIMDSVPLIGTDLLADSALSIDWWGGRDVPVEARAASERRCCTALGTIRVVDLMPINGIGTADDYGDIQCFGHRGQPWLSGARDG